MLYVCLCAGAVDVVLPSTFNDFLMSRNFVHARTGFFQYALLIFSYTPPRMLAGAGFFHYQYSQPASRDNLSSVSHSACPVLRIPFHQFYCNRSESFGGFHSASFNAVQTMRFPGRAIDTMIRLAEKNKCHANTGSASTIPYYTIIPYSVRLYYLFLFLEN